MSSKRRAVEALVQLKIKELKIKELKIKNLNLTKVGNIRKILKINEL